MDNIQIALIILVGVIVIILVRLNDMKDTIELLKKADMLQRRRICDLEELMNMNRLLHDENAKTINKNTVDHQEAINTMIERVNKLWDLTFTSIKNN